MSLLLALMKFDSTGPLDPAGHGKSCALAICGPSSLSRMRRSPAWTLRLITLLSENPVGNWWKCRITNWEKQMSVRGNKWVRNVLFAVFLLIFYGDNLRLEKYKDILWTEELLLLVFYKLCSFSVVEIYTRQHPRRILFYCILIMCIHNYYCLNLLEVYLFLKVGSTLAET